MDRTVKISITAGDVEIDLDGSSAELEEMLSLLRQDDSWGLMIDRLKVARNAAMRAAIAAAKASGLPERGSAFHTLVETCSLKRKPDQVLGAIHYLREVEGVSDSPPRVINQLFEDAGMEPPGNLSLYLNGRLISLRGTTITGSGANYVIQLPSLATNLRGSYRLDVSGLSGMPAPYSCYFNRI